MVIGVIPMQGGGFWLIPSKCTQIQIVPNLLSSSVLVLRICMIQGEVWIKFPCCPRSCNELSR